MARSKIASALMQQMCRDFGVDPDEVTDIEGDGERIFFRRTPLVFDIPAGYSTIVTIEEEG